MTIAEYAALYQKETDKQLIQASATGWMDKNSTQVIYTGGNTIKVPYITSNGYKDYDRATGYPTGSSTFNYETHTFDMDRGISFTIDSQDVDETNFGATGANLLAEFNATEAIPEKDAYRLSKIFSYIPAANKSTTTLTKENILTEVKTLISNACSLGIDPSNLVLQITWEAYNLLTLSEQIYRSLAIKEMNVDGIKLNFKTMDETIIVPTASARMKTAYTFWTGVTATDGEVGKNGFSPASSALQINFMVIPANAPIAITKADKFKIVSPEQNQDADAWKIMSRVYHTLIMTARKKLGVFVNYTATSEDTDDTTLTCNKTGTISDATFKPFTLTFSNNLEKLTGGAPTVAWLLENGFITITKDDVLFAGYTYAINTNKNVITVTANNNLANGVYVITTKGGVVRAAGSNLPIAAKTATFTLNVT